MVIAAPVVVDIASPSMALDGDRARDGQRAIIARIERFDFAIRSDRVIGGLESSGRAK